MLLISRAKGIGDKIPSYAATLGWPDHLDPRRRALV
jgi:hypothetical protein